MPTEPASFKGSDPSSLTTAQLQREIFNLEKLLTTRMESTEKAVEVAHENLTRVPTEVDKALEHVKDVINERGKTLVERFATVDEKFSSVQTQFRERDTRQEQSAKDTKVAIDAALMAAEKAVGKQQEASDRAIAKSENAVAKQIEAIVGLIASNTKAADEKIGALKERIDRGDGTIGGRKDLATESRASVSTAASVAGVIIALVVGVLGAGLFKRDVPVAPQVVYLPSPAAAAAAVPPVNLPLQK